MNKQFWGKADSKDVYLVTLTDGNLKGGDHKLRRRRR